VNFATGRKMREIPREQWPFMQSIETVPLRVWLSNDYLAVLYQQRIDGKLRLTVNRTRMNGRSWRDGITWDELQRIKNETLGADVWCVEVYPPESELVNVSNMRHLWVLQEPPETRFPKERVFSDDDAKVAVGMIRKMLGRK
jgi:hypothetical protein